jgi:hypothetical protein
MKDIPDKSVDMILCDLPYTFNGGGGESQQTVGMFLLMTGYFGNII